ncbi:MAG: site-2 protease family protein [Candidatus Omnitrophota bacterium]
MKGSFKIAEVAGISINVHFTFLLLVLLFGKWFFFVLAVFFFVTMHELAHSLVAKKFGIKVREITLLPIGGVASMARMPEKPYQEFLISIAGPASNLAVVVIFFFPMQWIFGSEFFFLSLKAMYGGYMPVYSHAFIICQIYWINLVLAVFNMLPAFPMDGGRILRALLAGKLGMQRATKIAVNFGQVFALLFGYLGLVQGRILLIIIAVFIYLAASSEELQVDLRATLRKFRVKDILSGQFVTLNADATFSKVLELMFHTRQEDFPVMDAASGRMAGFITRQDIISGIHTLGLTGGIASVMRTDVPGIYEGMRLDEAQAIMQSGEFRALPVMRDGHLAGIISIDDINRVYGMMSVRR